MRTKMTALEEQGGEKNVEAAIAECTVTWKWDVRINLVGDLSFYCAIRWLC